MGPCPIFSGRIPSADFDVGRAGIERFIDDALANGDEATLRGALEELRRLSQPYLNWTSPAGS